MTQQEWNAIATRMALIWPSSARSFGPEAASVWWEDLSDYPAAAVLAAVERLKRTELDFIPSLGKLLNELELEPDSEAKPWLLVWAAARVAMRSFRPAPYGDPVETAKVVVERLALAAGRPAGDWLRAYGVSRLAGEPVDDPDRGGIVVMALQKSYEAFTAQTADERRGQLALAAGERGAGLRRVSALAHLPTGGA